MKDERAVGQGEKGRGFHSSRATAPENFQSAIDWLNDVAEAASLVSDGH
jgi:hypothetical protein